MNNEEIKQWLRTQIDSSIKIPNKFNKHMVYLSYNNSYLRALKLSKINGKPVNKNDFKGGEKLFWFNTKTKRFRVYSIIVNYLNKHYSCEHYNKYNIITEVLNEYEEYKGI